MRCIAITQAPAEAYGNSEHYAAYFDYPREHMMMKCWFGKHQWNRATRKCDSCGKGLERLSQRQLAKVAIDEKQKGWVRQAAVSRLTDQAILARVAIEDKEAMVRKVAVKRLAGNPSILAKVVIEDNDAGVRAAAAEKATDQPILAKIAVEDKDAGIRMAAVRKLLGFGLPLPINGDANLFRDSSVQANDLEPSSQNEYCVSGSTSGFSSPVPCPPPI